MRTYLLAAVGVLALALAVAIGTQSTALALAQPLNELATTTVTCGTTPTEITGGPLKKSMLLSVTGSTAAFVGGSNVDGSTAGTTGVSVCDGCTMGKTLSLDVRRAWCMSVGGAVKIEVLHSK